MNSECSIWRVLIYSVNFAPGYPRRYAGSVWIGRLMPRARCDGLKSGSSQMFEKQVIARTRKQDLKQSRTKTDLKTTHATMELSLDLLTE